MRSNYRVLRIGLYVVGAWSLYIANYWRISNQQHSLERANALPLIRSVNSRSGRVAPRKPRTKRSIHEADIQRVSPVYGSLPLSFEINEGQSDAGVQYISRGPGYTLYLATTGASFTLNDPAEGVNRSDSTDGAVRVKRDEQFLRMEFRGANVQPAVIGFDELPGKVNYFFGSDPHRWRTDIRTYAKVQYRDIYDGVDLIYYGNQGHLEYDFVVHPGADPSLISVGFEGAQGLDVDDHGSLILRMTDRSEVRLRKPRLYQEVNGVQQAVEGDFVQHGPYQPYDDRNSTPASHEIGFSVGAYDVTKPLIIDPVLVYESYALLKSGSVSGISVDLLGNAYVVGQTSSSDLPMSNAFQGVAGGINVSNLFVMKLNSTGSALIYSTYLGGSVYDSAGGIAVDSDGNAYVTGGTLSRDFPTTAGAFQPQNRGVENAFITKLSATGSLVYSSYLGGTRVDGGTGIAVDTTGNAYLAGYTSSLDFPTLHAFQASQGGGSDAFVTKLNADGSGLIYSTYLGGKVDDTARGIAIDAAGCVYITGDTTSSNFPLNHPYQSSFNDWAAFVTKLSPEGSSLLYSTYLGGGVTIGHGIVVDAAAQAYVVGSTTSTVFPTTPNALNRRIHDPFLGGGFLTKLNAAGSALLYSTVLDNRANAIAVDGIGTAYVQGPANVLTTPQISPHVMAVDTLGGGLVYSIPVRAVTSIAVDPAGSAYVAGASVSIDVPATGPAQPNIVIAKVAQIGLDIAEGSPFLTGGGLGMSMMSTGSSDMTTVGYASIQTDGGGPAPDGIAFVGFRQNGVLITEAAFPASRLVQSGRIYAEVQGSVNTGLVIANPHLDPAIISYFFTDANGQDFGGASITVPGNSQLAQFLSEPPFSAGTLPGVSLTFTSSISVAVAAIRGFTNERGEFLITNLPIAQLASTAGMTSVVAQFADGGGWKTRLVLLNPTDQAISGSIQFYSDGTGTTSGQPLNVNINGQADSTFTYAIPARSSRSLSTSGASTNTLTGTIRVAPAAASPLPIGLAIFSFTDRGVTVTESGVASRLPGSSFLLYAESNGNLNAKRPGSFETGIAVANVLPNPVIVTFSLTTLSGESLGTGTASIPGNGHVALFLSQIHGFENMPVGKSFAGVMRITTDSPGAISVVGLRARYNERLEFLIATTPPIDENDDAPANEVLFPQLVAGGGYATELVLFSGATPALTGAIRFFTQSGNPTNLSFRTIFSRQ
jgi:hypothetical protein